MLQTEGIVNAEVIRMQKTRHGTEQFNSWPPIGDVHHSSIRAASARQARDVHGPASSEIASTAEVPAPFRVVVAFDDTAASWSALEAANSIARLNRGTVAIVHAAQPRVSSFDGVNRMKRAVEIAHKEAQDVVALARQALDSDVPSTSEVLSGDPADAIVRRAVELDADLLVVGSQQRGPLGRLLVGSVSDAIVRRATSPVLVVPAARRDSADGRRNHLGSERSPLPAAA
jgi:nucleotide-binding universal stress UspA family protein